MKHENELHGCQVFSFGTVVCSILLVVGGATCGSRLVMAQGDPSFAGEWSPLQSWPIEAVHAHLLPTNGKVMFYPTSDDPRLWDPATGAITTLAKCGHNIFCSGHCFLANGRLIVAGGDIAANVGLPNASIYDPAADSWTHVPDMNAGRWYPTNTTLANGDVLVASGSIDNKVGINPLPQVWQTASSTWRELTHAHLKLPLYPWMYLAPNGKVFSAGPTTKTQYLDTVGKGRWTNVTFSNFGYRDKGSSVMYDNGKVIIVGGHDPPTATAELIDLNAASPSWRATASMSIQRRQLNATLLPDGKVLVVGGSSVAGWDEPSGAVLYAEMWDPATETWSTMASHTRYRGYHSIALLLPDGRVLSAGGDFSGRDLSSGGDTGFNAEVYSPPYLFNGARPTITSAPKSVSYGETFLVETPDALGITQVTWIRLSSVTHGFDQNQRINRLGFSQINGGLAVSAPSNANVCPLGHYMLFILNGDGVPSVSQILKIE